MTFQFITTNDTKTAKIEEPLFSAPIRLRVVQRNYQHGQRFKTTSFDDLTEAPEGANHSSLTEGEIG